MATYAPSSLFRENTSFTGATQYRDNSIIELGDTRALPNHEDMTMTEGTDKSGARSYWFVGAMYGGSDDQMPRFIAEGIWENGYTDKYLDVVRAIQPGDRIAI